ncbi:MAG: lactate dehydrogenase [Anaerovoracaceae bacterium]
MFRLTDMVKDRELLASQLFGAPSIKINGKNRVHVLALGDVGGMLVTGLKLLGGDVISILGIYDVNENVKKRYEYEMNQIAYPWDYDALPEVHVIEKEELFQCDVFVFCASKGVPGLGTNVKDVRMAQLEANAALIGEYAKMARDSNFQGLFAVISDPVDPLCKAAYLSSNQDEAGETDGKGLKANQIQGYGLGVMNSRAAYFAKKEPRFKSFLSEGRAFGPHGADLIIANSIKNYDDKLSQELTKLTVEANLKVRKTGFKPFIAPALSSGAISLLLTLRGEWHYSSNILGDVYMGSRNRMTESGVEIENNPLPELLYRRIEKAYKNLQSIM